MKYVFEHFRIDHKIDNMSQEKYRKYKVDIFIYYFDFVTSVL